MDIAVSSWVAGDPKGGNIIFVRDSCNRHTRYPLQHQPLTLDPTTHRKAAKQFCKEHGLKQKEIITGYLRHNNTFVHILKGVKGQ